MEAKEKKRELSRDPKQILKREKYWREKYRTEKESSDIKMKISVAVMSDSINTMERMLESLKRGDTLIKILFATNFVVLVLYIFK